MAISRASNSSIQGGLPKFNDIWDGTTNVSSFDSLGVVSLNAATSSVTFSNIPQTYTHLQVRFTAKAAPTAADAAYDLLTYFNGDTTIGNYGTHYLGGNGTGTFQGYTGNLAIFGTVPGSGNTNIFGSNIMDILDYSNSNKFTTGRNLFGYDFNGSGAVAMQSYLWRNSNPVTSIQFVFRTGPIFAQYSSFALYGIK